MFGDGGGRARKNRKTWISTVNEDIKIMKVNKEEALDKIRWKTLVFS